MMRKNCNKKEYGLFSIYILGFMILSIVLVLNQPLAVSPPMYGNPPDEVARYLVPQYICEYGKLPTGFEEEVRIKYHGFSYALYNAFPYIVQGYLMRFVSLFSDSELVLLFAARLVNVFFGTMMAVVIYLLSKELFQDMRFRWLFCFSVMYLPQNIFIHSYVNTDSCCMLATAMIVYGIVLIYFKSISVQSILWLSSGIILCALSYYNAYGYILSSIILFLLYFVKRKNNNIVYEWKKMLVWGTVISIVVFLGIGWWFIRCYILFDGDMLGLQTRMKMSILYADDVLNPLFVQTYKEMRYSILEMVKERNTFSVAFRSFIATYGSMSIIGSKYLYRIYKLFFLTGAIGLVYYLLDKKEKKKILSKATAFHINMIFCVLMPLILMLYYAYTIDYQAQGRYLLPSLIPLMYYTVKGIEKIAAVRWKNYKLPVWSVNLGLLCCIIFILGGAIDMIFVRALPIYLETGVVLK